MSAGGYRINKPWTDTGRRSIVADSRQMTGGYIRMDAASSSRSWRGKCLEGRTRQAAQSDGSRSWRGKCPEGSTRQAAQSDGGPPRAQAPGQTSNAGEASAVSKGSRQLRQAQLRRQTPRQPNTVGRVNTDSHRTTRASGHEDCRSPASRSNQPPAVSFHHPRRATRRHPNTKGRGPSAVPHDAHPHREPPTQIFR